MIASGGITSIEDLQAVQSFGPRVEGAIVGKALYDGKLDYREAVASLSQGRVEETVTRSTMLTKRIIPCLDVKDGRVVKGVSFVNLRDAGDPVEVAAIYDREGADELCFLDITASHENRKTIIDVVEQTAARVFMPLTVGGGVRTLEDIRALLNAGADKVSINTTAVQQPDFVREAAQRFGTQCIVVAIDAKRSEQTRSLGGLYPWRSEADRP